MLIILGLILFGLLVGALGRLAIPGPNPMSLPMTIAVGVGGALLGGLIGALLFEDEAPTLLLAVAVSALIVWLMQRNDRRVTR